jgi:microcystin-dependent protein
MATVTPGYIFQNNEVVTPTRLNSAATPSVAVANDEITTDKILNAAVTTTKIADSAITSAKIADGTIVNADISTTAAIADSKLAQIATAGKVLPAAVQGTAVITTDSRLSDTRTPTDLSVTTAKIADSAITSAKIANGAVTQEKLNSSVTLVPTGAVMPFAMNSAPSGWLAANGSAVSRTTYAALFAAIGTTYGTGDGSTTFTLPDLRGYFVRGAGTNADGTASEAFGTKQADAFQGHRHTVTTKTSFNLASSGPSNNSGWFNVTQTSSDPVSDTVNGTPRTASETRPKNIALLYCIKF